MSEAFSSFPFKYMILQFYFFFFFVFISFHSQRSTFSVGSPSDTTDPIILDTKLLPGGLVVLSDSNNKSVKLYDWQVRVFFYNLFCVLRFKGKESILMFFNSPFREGFLNFKVGWLEKYFVGFQIV